LSPAEDTDRVVINIDGRDESGILRRLVGADELHIPGERRVPSSAVRREGEESGG
jgi:hypothetical protein